MSEPLTPAGQPDHGPPDPVFQPLHFHDTPGLKDWRGCQRCGEETRAYKTIEGRDYCETCFAILRLEDFHRKVTSER